ncbi:hypothetical protein DERF_005655 [Dermatophagoides farinae]|uniref:Uncharacterized protein n=1 Tax=Dermatophagoides farinae TaxID=6954 RepID=A0A922I3X2_DERFA|nr:hypothetical protein HUG17_3388 [Dermatophagoides farinae]KAH9522052.1 hypothetical protein DERF_005655 [Dermatophagoides farinae]
MIIITMIIKLLFHLCSFGIIIILINLCVAADQYSNQYQQTTTNPTLTIECRQQQSNCTDNIYPYLNDPQYMFPTSLEHVNEMCKMWSRFVDCIRRYISHCFEENRRQLFHKSVENSIDTVHAICSSKLYQTEYLARANCFKQISMDHCGVPYQHLVNNIANPMAKDEHICCTYAQFKRCVNRPLLEECGRKAKNLMDHSMSFLISRCQHYTDNFDSQIECSSPSSKMASIESIDSKTKITIDNENHHLNSIDQPLLGHHHHHQSPLLPPVHPESREWPESFNSDKSSSSSTDSTDSNINGMIESIEHNVNNKRELIHAHIGNVHKTFDNDDDNDYRKESSLIDTSTIIDPDMIIYTMKPESQIQFSSATSSTTLSNAKWLIIIITYTAIISPFFISPFEEDYIRIPILI